MRCTRDGADARALAPSRVISVADADGKPLRAAKTVTGGKREAEATLRRFITEVEHSCSPQRSMTVTALLERWIDHITPTRRPSTIDRYRRKIDKAINPALGTTRIDRLTAERLDRQYRAWLDAGLSPSTVHVYHPGRSWFERVEHGANDFVSVEAAGARST